MNALIESVEVWSQALMLLSWKGTLLALAVGLVLLLVHRHLSPAWRHGLWLLVLLRFMVPDLGNFALSLDGLTDVPAMLEPAASVAPEAAVTMEAPAEILSLRDVEPPVEMTSAARPAVQTVPTVALTPAWSVRQKLSVLWLCGVAAVFSVMMVLHLRLQRRIRRDAGEAFSEVSAVLEEACRLAQVRHTPRLWVTDAVREPSLFGILKPVILLPKQVAAGKDAAALKLILLHELAHLKRHDLWAQILSSCMIALHWFNPMVWIAARRLRAEAEMAADAHALRCTGASEAHRYGEMLLGFTRYATTGWMVWFASAALLGISENKNDLRRRIEGLMDIARGRRTRWVFGLGAFMLLAVIGLTRAPAEDVKKSALGEASKASDDSTTTAVIGIVVDENGKPVKQAAVKLSVILRSRSEVLDKLTDDEGKFRFEAVPKAASLNLRARHGDFAESNFIVFQGVSASEERRLVLPAISWIRGKITDKRDGRPIKDAWVFFGTENKFAALSRYEWKHPFARTNEAGEYRLAVKVMDKKGMVVRAWAPDMAVQSRVMEITERETAFDAALEPAQPIPVSVVDAGGEPVKDAMVWVVEDSVRLDESTKPITLESMRSKDRVKMTNGNFFISLGYSKEDGSVQLPEADALLKDKLWVVAMHPKAGFARMRAGQLKPGVVFKLERWAMMSGKMMRSDGSPVAETTVVIHAKGDSDMFSSPESLKISHEIKVTTDLAGGYKISHLLPGATFTGLTIKGEYTSILPVTVGSGEQAPRQITLGESLRARGKTGVRAVQGRIVLPEGHAFRSEVYNMHLSISSNGVIIPGLPTPDKDGRFITEALRPGNYELSLTVMPKGPGMELERDAGRWMRFQIGREEDKTPLRLEDIVLEKAELVPTPRKARESEMAQPPVFVEGPEGKIEITTIDVDKKPVPGVKIEILDYVDHARAPLGLAKSLGKSANFVSDENGKVTLSFQRMPVAGRKASGVQIIGTAKEGAKSRITELMDGRKSELRIYPETPVDVTFSTPISEWTAGSLMGVLAENQSFQGGALKTRLALEHGTHFVLQGKTAEGRLLFSHAIGAGRGQEVKGEVTLEPGVEIDGKIEGLPAEDEGTGCVMARVFVKSEGEMNRVSKGFPPAVSWAVWAPVGRDGRFHLTGMPRGMMSLSGVGKGWATRGSLKVTNSTLVNIASSTTGKASVTVASKPCVRRAVRILLPDGTPAAGATVQAELPGIDMMSFGRTNVYAEDSVKYERFKKQAWTARQTVADDQGQITLENVPEGKVYCIVYWVDPKTQHPHSGTASVSFESPETNAPMEMTVREQ